MQNLTTLLCSAALSIPFHSHYDGSDPLKYVELGAVRDGSPDRR